MQPLHKSLLSLLAPVVFVGGTWLMIGGSDSAPQDEAPTESAGLRTKRAPSGPARPAAPRSWRSAGLQASAPRGSAPTVQVPLEAAPEGSFDEEGDMPRDPEAELAVVLSAWEGKLSEHQHEATDRRWKAMAEPRFHDDLLSLALDGEQQRFEVSGVDCRSETCVATIDFGSYEDARTSVGSLLQHHYEVNCATTTIMPQPDDTTQPYSAQVLFECAPEYAS